MPFFNAAADRVVKLTAANVVTAAGPTTVAANTIVPVDTTANAVGITLPTSPPEGSRIVLKHITQGGANVVTVTAGGSAKFNKADGSTSKTLVLLNQAMNLQYAATAALWYVVSEDMPLLAMDTRYVARVASTTAALVAVANDINTADKYIGKMVFNATTGKPVYATGTTAASVWKDAVGVLAHTPV